MRLILICFLLFSFIACAPGFAADTKLQEAIKLYNNKQFKESLVLFEEVIKSNPQDAYASYYAAMASQQTGNMSAAKRYYKAVYNLQPNGQLGGYAKSILLKVDPSSVASSLATGTNSGAATAGQKGEGKGTTPGAAASQEDSTPKFDPRYPKEFTVRCRKEHGSIMVTPTLDGRPVDMVFDTGAPGITIGKDQLEAIGLRPPSGKPDGVTGGAANASLINFWDMKTKVKLGPVEKEMDLCVLESNSSPPLFGQTFFKQFDYTIDQGGGSIFFRQKGLAQGKDRNAYSVPFEFIKHGNRIVVTVEINGRPGKVMFDTGNSASAIKFHSQEQAEKYGLRVPEDAAIGYTQGVSGRGRVRIFPINRVKLGPIDQSNVECAVNDEGHDGTLPLLGEPFWKNYQYTIDMDNKQIHFVRR
ncbi:MAG: retroviral-like aspartic protease family protein [Candidatus Melainabacteria bacterium]|nr:retroviral-like aspartic protease family protein [Candidatus Melainabacteria bacterium]